MITIISCNSKPKIYGCTDSSAINYNPVAEQMKDSACIQRTYVETENRPHKIYIDHKKYNNVHYKFVYNINDTINDEYITSWSEKNNFYYFRSIRILKIDTIFYNPSNINNKNIGYLYLPRGKNIQVFEILDEKIKNTYYIDILGTVGEYLINPFKNYRYKISQTVYSNLPFLPGEEFFNPIKFSAFLNEINYEIDYWFEDPPKEIMVSQYQLSEKRYDISRY